MFAPSTPQVSVVIPSYNRIHSLTETLAGLAQQTLSAAAFEVIVVDNASTDGTFEAVQTLAVSMPYRLHVFRIPTENRGPAPARNFGVSKTSGAIVAFTDSDCRPDARWLERGLAAFEDADVAFATGTVDFKQEQLGTMGFFARRTVVCAYEHPTYPTANAFFRKNVFLEFGGFSEELSFASVFGTAMEAADTDLAWRIKEAGSRNVFVPDAIVFHEVQVTTPQQWLLEPIRLFLIPALVRRHPGMRQALLAYGVFFYAGSIRYYLTLALALVLLVVAPRLLLLLPPLLLVAGALRGGSARPDIVLTHAGQIGLNALRIYVMSCTLICGSIRFRTLVL